MNDLRGQIKQYTGEGWYPFHMPGHKRMEDVPLGEPSRIDITEIDGFDDLRRPEGIIKEAQEDAALLFGSLFSRFSVNGSTGGILAAITAACPKGSAVLADKRCHVSILNACRLRELEVIALEPRGYDKRTEIALPPTAEAVAKALKNRPEVKAVIITSPSYEGLVADVKGIAEAAHGAGCALIVDEAHGAHLAFAPHEEKTDPDGGCVFPKSAVTQGADLVVQSLHKTLPALTQTAVLHNCSDRIPQGNIDEAMKIFQTTSPSYVLLSSAIGAIKWAKEHPERFEEYAGMLAAVLNDLKSCKRLRLFDTDDAGKIILFDSEGLVSGKELYDTLREVYRLQPELYTDRYVLLMTSVADVKEGFMRLVTAAREIDGKLTESSVFYG